MNLLAYFLVGFFRVNYGMLYQKYLVEFVTF